MSIFEDRVTHLYTVAFRTFPKSATYTPKSGSPVAVTLVRTGSQEIVPGGSTYRIYQRYLARSSEVASPTYGDQVNVDGYDWSVEKFRPMAGNLFELTLRRDERVQY